MDDAHYLREQAERCRRLAWWIFDAEAIAKLEGMAREFERQAAALQNAQDNQPRLNRRCSG